MKARQHSIYMPDAVYDAVRATAAEMGMSISEFVRRALEKEVELRQRIAKRQKGE